MRLTFDNENHQNIERSFFLPGLSECEFVSPDPYVLPRSTNSVLGCLPGRLAVSSIFSQQFPDTTCHWKTGSFHALCKECRFVSGGPVSGNSFVRTCRPQPHKDCSLKGRTRNRKIHQAAPQNFLSKATPVNHPT